MYDSVFFLPKSERLSLMNAKTSSLSEQMKAKASKKKQKRANRQKRFSPCTTFATYEQSK